jgi:hypothetical protein
MGRFLAGVASALLLVTAGFFLWTGIARRDVVLPAVSAAVAGGEAAQVGAPGPAVDDPPEASEKTREQKRFDRYDRNRDGKVDRDEYLLSRHKAFAKLDTNGDGKLSFEEYSAKAIGKFAKADMDRSNTLDATEFATTRVQRKPRPKCPPAQQAVRPATDGEGSDEG